MVAFIYCRVSTGKQKADGFSLSAQAEVCMDLVKKEGLTLGTATNVDEPGVFIDSASAYKIPLDQRAGGRELVRHINPGDTIVMYAIDRGWRNLWQCAQYIEYWTSVGVNLRFVSHPSLDLTTANGKLTAHVMAAYAQWKSEIVGERGREYMAAREDGLIKGKPIRNAKLCNKQAMTTSAKVISSMVRPKRKEDEPLPVGKVYGYVRVSTDRQSVDSQLAPVYHYMEKLYADGPTPGGMIKDEGVSALKVQFSKRPEAAKLMKMLKRGDHIVFHRPARAFRSVKDMIEVIDILHGRGITVHLAEGGMKSGDLSFRLSMQIMVLMAQIESEENSRRVTDTLNWMWDSGLIPKSDCQLPRWIVSVILNNEKGEPERHIVPDKDYLEDCRFVCERLATGLPRKQVWKELEDMCAHRENRMPLPVGGWDPLLAMKKNAVILKDPDCPYTFEGQSDFRERCQKARAKKRLVNPTYRLRYTFEMTHHWDEYQEYLKLMEEEGQEAATSMAARKPRRQLAKV